MNLEEVVNISSAVVISNGGKILELDSKFENKYSRNTYLYFIAEDKIKELKNVNKRDIRALGVVFLKNKYSNAAEAIYEAYRLSWKFFNINENENLAIFFEKQEDEIVQYKLSELNKLLEEFSFLSTRIKRYQSIYKELNKLGIEILELLEEVPEENLSIDLFSKLYCVITNREDSNLSLNPITKISEEEVIYEKLISEYKNPHDLIQSFRKFLKCFYYKSNSTENKSDVKNNEARIVEIMQENYMDDLNLSKVSRAVDLSNSYAAKLIKNHTGENFTDYLNEIRLENAEILLKNTEMSINDISYNVGFNYPSYFRRIFKKKNNITAKEYRELYKYS